METVAVKSQRMIDYRRHLQRAKNILAQERHAANDGRSGAIGMKYDDGAARVVSSFYTAELQHMIRTRPHLLVREDSSFAVSNKKRKFLASVGLDSSLDDDDDDTHQRRTLHQEEPLRKRVRLVL